MITKVGDTLVLNADMLPLGVLPLSSMVWQDAIKAIWLDSVKVLEVYDDWIAHSPTLEMFVPSVVMTTRYVKPARAVQFSSEHVFLRDHFKCVYCNAQFSPYTYRNNLTVDHVVPRTFGGRTTWDNLVSACKPCNNKRGCNFRIQPPFKPYRPTYFEMAERRKEFSIEVPHAVWADYLMWPDPDGVIVRPNRRGKAKNASVNFDTLAA